MEILYFDKLDSTHIFLIDAIKNNRLKSPVAVVCNRQENGVGSGDNRWVSMDGNLFLSFSLELKSLPSDLPLGSASIYFSYILKETLSKHGSKVWIKWPNDFYIEDRKVGGLITKLINNKIFIVSVGLNIKQAPKEFAKLDTEIDNDRLINQYLSKVIESISWKYIFSKYEIEFNRSREYSYLDKQSGKKVSLKDAVLQKSGSIIVNNREVFSLR